MSKMTSKGWYYWTDPNEGKGYILAFVNAKGSCSLRRWEAGSGVFLEKQHKKGNYQDRYIGYLAFPLHLSRQPNLEKDCHARLPDWILSEVEQQIPSFILRKCDWLFGKLRRITPLELIRKIRPNLESYDFTDKWIVGETLCAFVLLGLSFADGVRGWERLFIVLGVWSISSILINLTNIVLFDPYRPESGRPYPRLSTRRSLILLFLNYIEMLAWFAIFYRNYYFWFSDHMGGLRTFWGSLYCSVVTMSTLGYGDIAPVTIGGAFLVIAQTLIGLFMVVFVLAHLVSILPRTKIPTD